MAKQWSLAFKGKPSVAEMRFIPLSLDPPYMELTVDADTAQEAATKAKEMRPRLAVPMDDEDIDAILVSAFDYTSMSAVAGAFDYVTLEELTKGA